jgi:hypothetical protein
LFGKLGGGAWSLPLGEIVHAVLQCSQLLLQSRVLGEKPSDQRFQFRDANIPLAASLAQGSIHAVIKAIGEAVSRGLEATHAARLVGHARSHLEKMQ